MSVDLVERLASLPAAQFAHLVLNLKVPDGVLSGESAPQRLRAVELVRYFRQPGYQTDTIQVAVDRLALIPADRTRTNTPYGSAPPVWSGSPFPGLRAFTTADAHIFFGRATATEALVRKLVENHFVAVVGSSGSGKSSLVGAGLLPGLKNNAVPGSSKWFLPFYSTEARQWVGLRFTPAEVDDNPYSALAAKLAPILGKRMRDLADIIAADADVLRDHLQYAAGGIEYPAALLFIDQFEELFTLCAARHREPFVHSLESWTAGDKIKVVLTLRSDFYQYSVDIAALARLLEYGTFRYRRRTTPSPR